jgi:hypothetical protein
MKLVSELIERLEGTRYWRALEVAFYLFLIVCIAASVANPDRGRNEQSINFEYRVF